VALQPLGYGHKQLIPTGMAQGFIHYPEMIAIHDHQGTTGCLTLAAAEAILQPFLEEGLIGKAGEGVKIRQLMKFFLKVMPPLDFFAKLSVKGLELLGAVLNPSFEFSVETVQTIAGLMQFAGDAFIDFALG
jgi:hypothetical protein